MLGVVQVMYRLMASIMRPMEKQVQWFPLNGDECLASLCVGRSLVCSWGCGRHIDLCGTAVLYINLGDIPFSFPLSAEMMVCVCVCVLSLIHI